MFWAEHQERFADYQKYQPLNSKIFYIVEKEIIYASILKHCLNSVVSFNKGIAHYLIKMKILTKLFFTLEGKKE